MADGTIGIDEPVTIDLNLDTENLGGTPPKHRERVQITGAILAEIARVLNSDQAITDYGLVVRPIVIGRVSTVNSTTVNLGIGAAFTGTSEEVKDYAEIRILVFANQNSATDGLSLEYSSNGTNWDDFDRYTVLANTAKAISAAPEARYFRVVYTNGGVAQTAFRLQTLYHYHRTKPSSHRVGDLTDEDISENDAELVIAVTTGQVPHDAVDFGNPQKLGGRASATPPTAVASGDRVNAYFDTNGRLVVVLDTALPAGANNIGDVDIASPLGGGVEVGAVRVTVASDSTGVISVDDNAGSLTIDGNVGLLAGINNIGDVDIASPLPAGTNNIGKVDSRARNLADSAYVEPSTLGEQQTHTTALQLIDDIVHAINAAFNKAAAIGGQLDDTATVAATEDNVAPVRITAQRGLHANLRNNAGAELGTATTPVRTDPTGTTTQPISDAAGSVTVDAPVGTPVAVRTSDGAAFIDPRSTGPTTKTIEFAVINAAVAGNNTIVAADVSNKIKVVQYVVVADAAVSMRWEAGADVAKSGLMALAANGGISAVAPAGFTLIETAVNEALIIDLGAAVGVRGHLTFYREP